MEMRELKALEIAARSRVVYDDGAWVVPSQSSGGNYRVRIGMNDLHCQCEDFQLRQADCKHTLAAKLVYERDGYTKRHSIDADAVPTKKTYKQDWTAYTLAQTTEKTRFQELLFDLCRGVEEPPRHKKGGRRTYMREMVFASAFKVFSTYSGRRFACDLHDAHTRGFLARPISPMSVLAFIESDALTPFLYQLIERSAFPLRAIETTFAPDSTGFSTSRFVRWYDEKWGQERSGRAWVKAHCMTGTKTNVVTAAIVDSPTAADCPFFRPLLEQTVANGFGVRTVCADKGYLSRENLELAEKHNAAVFIPFKVNSVAGEPGTVWERMFHYFQYHRSEFLAKYHARSNVESTFSMVKAKFRDHVRGKTDTAMKNEVLLKLLCHNVVVVHQAITELGITAEFWQESRATGEREGIPFCRNQNAHAGTKG
jgi:transposase